MGVKIKIMAADKVLIKKEFIKELKNPLLHFYHTILENTILEVSIGAASLYIFENADEKQEWINATIKEMK